MSVKVNVAGGAMVNSGTGSLAPVLADIGPPGPASTVPGPAGWSPVLAGELDGTRTLIKVVDWTGGAGIKPETGMYLGTSGYVATKALAFNFNAIKRVVPMSGVTNASGIATIDYSSYGFAIAPVIITLPATTTILSGVTRSTVVTTPAASAPTKDRALVKVDQAALLTSIITLLVGATANVLVIEN